MLFLQEVNLQFFTQVLMTSSSWTQLHVHNVHIGSETIVSYKIQALLWLKYLPVSDVYSDGQK